MRRMWVWAWIGCAALAVPVVASAETLIEDVDRLGENVLAEAEAMRALAAAIQAEVDAGRLTLSAEALAAWPAGRIGWEQVRNLALERKFGPAYKTARELRPVLRRAFREAFDGRPATSVTDALRAYVDAIQPRITALTAQIENYPLTREGRESYHVGSAMWTVARKSVKKRSWDHAFRELMDALGELDRVVYEAYPPSR